MSVTPRFSSHSTPIFGSLLDTQFSGSMVASRQPTALALEALMKPPAKVPMESVACRYGVSYLLLSIN